MRTDDLIHLAIANLPTVLSVLFALGMFKLAGSTLKRLADQWTADVKRSPSKVDDAVLLIPLRGMRELGAKLESGEIDNVKAAQAIKAIAEQAERAKRRSPRGHVRVGVLVVLVAVLAGAPALAAIGYVKSWHVQVTTTAARTTVPSGGEVLFMECNAPEAGETGDTVLIAAGGSDVNPAAGASRNGKVFCGDGCKASSARAAVGSMFLRSASTVEISCWAVVARP